MSDQEHEFCGPECFEAGRQYALASVSRVMEHLQIQIAMIDRDLETEPEGSGRLRLGAKLNTTRDLMVMLTSYAEQVQGHAPFWLKAKPE